MMDYCNTKALETKDVDMKVFWRNAGIGFERKMLNEKVYRRED